MNILNLCTKLQHTITKSYRDCIVTPLCCASMRGTVNREHQGIIEDDPRGSVSDPHLFYADPEPTKNLNADPDPGSGSMP
jgi:hypothetical protein